MKNTVFWHVALCNLEVYGLWQNTLSCCSTLKIAAVSSPEISVNFYQTTHTQHHIPGDIILEAKNVFSIYINARIRDSVT
jgi:hypothetical protein